MPLVTLMNPKGGSSKSTSALVLASTLAHSGAKVAVLDCDPNAPLIKWASGGSALPLTVWSANTDDVIDRIEELDRENSWIIVDTEGTANMLVSTVLLRTDLAVIPISMSSLDADMASRAIRLVKTQGKASRREVPFRILFTRTSPSIVTRVERKIIQEIDMAGIQAFRQALHTRQAFISMFEEKLSLWELDRQKVAGVEKAITNARALTTEMVVTVSKILSAGAVEKQRVAAQGST